MSSGELDTRPRPREDVKALRLPHSDLNRTVGTRSGRPTQLISSHLMSLESGYPG